MVRRKNDNRKGFLFSHRLEQLRHEKKMSRKQLADQSGVTYATITRLESGNFITTTDTLVKLADFFNVSYGYLLGESTDLAKRGATSDKVREKLTAFLDKVLSMGGDISDIVDYLHVLVNTYSKEISLDVNIEKEEEVLGLWWTIVQAYEMGDWDLMVMKSEMLMKLATSLSRPHLVALGRAYKAKAIRNKGTNVALKEAENEFLEIPTTADYQSALILRLRAKIYSRKEALQEALDECYKALKIIDKSKRDDALFLLEKVKLFRNLATYHRRIAVAAVKISNEQFEEHSNKAYGFLTRAGDALKSLEKYLRDEAEIEEMLLAYNFALYYEAVNENKQARDSAVQALELAEKMEEEKKEEEDYAMKIKMFLVHINVKLQDMDKASSYYGRLFPIEKHKTGLFKRHYDDLVEKHEKELLEYLGFKAVLS